jgi:predicted SAM-dependent methyltransferase
MTNNKINLACGDTYLKDWINIDFSPHSTFVRKANLLGRLPLAEGEASVVYSSHFIEHIPCELVDIFINECFRITKSGGRIRLVLPDWEELCDCYLDVRRKGEHEKANFLMLEMLDQCVRRTTGGALGKFYETLQRQPEKNLGMIDFVRYRTGHNIEFKNSEITERRYMRLLRNTGRIMRKIERLYIRGVIKLLPPTFLQQNVSLTSIGEKHAWMYDFYSVEQLLLKAGFIDVQKMTANTSNIPNFPFFPLDIVENGSPRKGTESMYIEAVKP